MKHTTNFFSEVRNVCERIDLALIERLAEELAQLRAGGGRLFLLGVGGSAANCSHAVNDFRKLCGIDAYTPIDNVSELTARANDEGWESIFSGWLEVSRLSDRDALLIYSVGGGDAERNISRNLIGAIDLAKARGVSWKHVHVENDKLLIQGAAPNQAIKNEVWDKIKSIDAGYADLTADISIDASLPAPARIHEVVSGDTLSKIAKQYYGEASKYMKIFEANKDQLKDPDHIKVGQKLKIPD